MENKNTPIQPESPKQTFDRLLYRTIAPALRELNELCRLQKAPSELSHIFSVGCFEEGTIKSLINDTLEAYPAKFLE